MPPKKPNAHEVAIWDERIMNQFKLLHERLIDSGTWLIKFLFIMNSGAALALLTFVGKQNAPYLFHKLQWAFKWLVIGILTSVLSGLAVFLRQNCILRDFKGRFNKGHKDDKRNSYLTFAWLNTACFMCLISLTAFIISIFKASHILSNGC